jgi:hypothetical protein
MKHLGLLTGGKPKGKGRGGGWDWTLSETDLLTATFIQYALDRMGKHTLGGHGIGDAGLWAFLWGAPVPLPVVRYYLIQSLDAVERQVKRRLESRKADREDEVFDLIDRLAQRLSYDHPVFKAAGVRVGDRERLGQETLSAFIGKRWETVNEPSEFYARFIEENWVKITRLLAGSQTANTEQYFEQFAPSRIEEELQFYSYTKLRAIYCTCPDKRLLVIQVKFANGQLFLDRIADALQRKKQIPKQELKRAEDLRALYSMLAHFSPEAVVGLLLWDVMHTHELEQSDLGASEARAY